MGVAMTLRLDEVTSTQLRSLAQATGHSQQQVVQTAVREYITKASLALDEQKRARREVLRRANWCRPVDPETGLPRLRPKVTTLADGVVIHPAQYPLREPPFMIEPPPGGSMTWLDREDRV